MAHVTPLHKKPSLDRNSLKNYRPVSNLSFTSKLIEKVVANQLNEFISHEGLLNVNTNTTTTNSTFIALNLRQKTDSKAHHTKTLFNIQKPETLQGSAPRRKQKGDWKFRVGMLFQRGMTSTLT